MKSLRLNGQILDLSRPQVMAILNVTPDSFYDGGRWQTEEQLLLHAERCLEEGASILDIGGYSSRPGALDIDPSEEIRRIEAPIKLLNKHFPEAHISIDTFRKEVAQAACAAGAEMINDISGGTLDEEMLPFVIRHKVPYVLMHMRGRPQTMSQENHYKDLEGEVFSFLQHRLHQLQSEGLADVVIDPGFGFAKDLRQSFRLLRNLEIFTALDAPILVGLSRKSMIYKTLSCTPQEALSSTAALHFAALERGANILRAHDVKEAKEAIKLHEALHAS